MSNFLAIATVTATLSQMLKPSVSTDVPGASVSTLRPDRAVATDSDGSVNLYLFQITPNVALRSDDLPTRRSDGTVIQRPRAAVDLHYLLSFYGNEGELVPQRLLGSVVRTLHARPILSRDLIRQTVLNPSFSYLAPSDLAEAVESVKLTPLSLDLEELSKLWSVFFQTPYTLSIAYQASVVLIEAEVTPQKPLPVLDRNIYVIPWQRPVIEKVESQGGRKEVITIESTLVIKGRQLQGQETWVRIGQAISRVTNVRDTEIIVPLQSNTLVDTLRSGVQGIQVIYPLNMGTPAVPHRNIESNVAAFVLHPIITVDQQQLTVERDDSNNPIGYSLTIISRPPVGRQQRVVLFLNQLESTQPAPVSFVENLPPALPAYRFEAPPNNGIPASQETTDRIVFKLSLVAAGDYLVRLQVDGAENVLETGPHPDPNHQPEGDRLYISPRVTIPPR